MALDLEVLSLSDLKKLQKNVVTAISTFERRQKAEALSRVEAFARGLGYSLSELVGASIKAKRSTTAPKFRHPENPALTWSGKGRKPRWFTAALDLGKTAAELKIE
ncbi:MAG: transcriptional regulator [Rhodobacterales bacterium 34-62-10]|nr:MAG: transcriptional regulator [Rhodobacterales bacterium 34-62-10]